MIDNRLSMEQMDRLWMLRWTEMLDNLRLMWKKELISWNYPSQMRMDMKAILIQLLEYELWKC